MSGHTQPELSEQGVHWSLPAETGRFYYECTPKENLINLPWAFDVSYKLNGVPKRAEELSGAAGLVEINIECIPNKNSEPYYKNNLLLQAATMVNLEDTLSVEAPGAQLQSIGTYKAVIFAALPGEHTTFTLRIGTQSFQSAGVILMMIPGTLEQMKQIKTLKQVKDTVGDSADAIYGSLDDILSVLGGLSGSLKGMQAGFQGINGTRDSFSHSKNGLYDSADDAIADLSMLSGQMLSMVPSLQDGQTLINDMNRNINQLIETADQTKTYITDFKGSIQKTREDLTALRQLFNDLSSAKGDRAEVFQNLQTDLDNLKTGFSDLSAYLKAMESAAHQLARSAAQLDDNLTKIPMPEFPPKIPSIDVPEDSEGNSIDSIISALAQILNGAIGNVNSEAGKIQAELQAVVARVNHVIQCVANVMRDTSAFVGASEKVIGILSSVCENGADMTETLQSAIELADHYFNLLENSADSGANLISELKKAGDTTTKALDTASLLLTQLDSLNDTLNSHKDSMTGALSSLQDTTMALRTALDSVSAFLTTFRNVLKENGASLNDSTQTTLDSLIQVLERGLDAVQTTDSIRNANRTVKDAVDGEVDKVEDETNFLDLDAESTMVSFTSRQNPEPASIQVILRTQEIGIENSAADISDMESAAENKGVFARIADVFKKIWTALASVFS